MELFLPGVVPKESLKAHFQLVLPLKWKDENYKPICVHFGGTGDHVCFPNNVPYQFYFQIIIPPFTFPHCAVLLAKKTFHGKTTTTRRKHWSTSIGKSILWS